MEHSLKSRSNSISAKARQALLHNLLPRILANANDLFHLLLLQSWASVQLCPNTSALTRVALCYSSPGAPKRFCQDLLSDPH